MTDDLIDRDESDEDQGMLEVVLTQKWKEMGKNKGNVEKIGGEEGNEENKNGGKEGNELNRGG